MSEERTTPLNSIARSLNYTHTKIWENLIEAVHARKNTFNCENVVNV